MVDSPRWRDALLSDPKLHASIRKTLRNHGVPAQEVEDLLQDTLKKARVARLPEGDDEGSRKYIHRTAANLACDFHGDQRDDHDEFDECAVAVPATAPAAFEARDLLRKTFAVAHERFPRTFHWFLRVYALDESPKAIAAEAQVSDGYVRHEVSVIQRSVFSIAVQLGVTAFGILLLVLIVWRGLWKHDLPTTDPDTARSAEHRELTPAQNATGLRSRASAECDAEDWQPCLDDLDQARTLDPAGDDDPQVQAMRRRAGEHLHPPAPRKRTPDFK